MKYRKSVAAVLAASMLSIGSAGLVSTAFADDTVTPAPSPSTSDAPTTAVQAVAGRITILAPDASGNNMVAPSVNGRTFTAYRIGQYDNPVIKDGNVVSYNLKYPNGITNETAMGWIKAVVVTNNAEGSPTVATNMKDLIAVDADGDITFINEAENISALQFIGKYFYGQGTDLYGNDHANNAQMRALADVMMDSLKTNTSVGHVSATGADGKVTLDTSSIDEGLYLIVDTSTKTDKSLPEDELISRVMVTGTPMVIDGKTYSEVVTTRNNKEERYQLGVLYLKADKVEMDKETVGDDMLIHPGSERTFTITTNVPSYRTDYQGWTNPTFYITDNPSSNINPFDAQGNVNSLVVTATNPDGESTTLNVGADKDYVVDVTNDGSEDANDFRITLNDPGKYSEHGIKVEYKGTITNLDVATNVNEAKVTFSNDPYSNGTDEIEDNEYLYDAEIPLEKIKFNDVNTKLSGAEFEVKQGDKVVSFIHANKVDDTVDASGDTAGKDESYTMYTGNKTGDNIVDKVTVNERSVLRGLAADVAKGGSVTYTFTETKAPEGYLLGDTAQGTKPVSFTLTITPTFDDDGEFTGATAKVVSENHQHFIDLSSSDVIGADGQTVTPTATTGQAVTTLLKFNEMRVENTNDVSDFAKTGGAIMTVIIACAVLLAIGTGSLIVVKQRRKRA